jgi:hypothetical protein
MGCNADHKTPVRIRGWPYHGWDGKPDIYALAEKLDARAVKKGNAPIVKETHKKRKA